MVTTFHRSARLIIVVALVAILMTLLTPNPAAAAAPEGWTIESVDRRTGTITAKDGSGQTQTITLADRGLARNLEPGQVISIDPATKTLSVTVSAPYTPGAGDGAGDAAGGAMESTASDAKGSSNTKTKGSPTVVKPHMSTIKASEGSTAMAIRGRPVPDSRQLQGLIGVHSGDEENADGEKDEPFPTRRLLMPDPRQPSRQQQSSGGAVTLADHPDPQGFVDRVAKAMKDREIDVALIGLRKYMVTDCLGIKASVGHFRLKLANPVAKIDGTRAVFKFEIDKVSMTGMKVRFRPNPNNVGNPCTFGGRVEIGGTASDVRLECTVEPLVDLQNCRIVDPGHIKVKVRIGGLNLKPVNNELDKVAKNMIEDAITTAMQYYADNATPGTGNDAVINTFGNEFYRALDNVLELDCPGTKVAGAANETAGKVGMGATAADAGKGAGPAPAGTGTGARPGAAANMPRSGGATAAPAGAGASPGRAKFTITPNPAARGRLGRLIVRFPEGAKTDGTHIEAAAMAEPDKRLAGAYGQLEADLMPGKYRVTVGGAAVDDVEVKSSRDTVVHVGVLRITAGPSTRVEVLGPDDKPVNGAYGSFDVGLPVGVHKVRVAGQDEPVTVEKDRIAEF